MTKLNDANLKDASSQKGVTLKRADLRGAIMTNVELNDADLWQADVSFAVDLDLEGVVRRPGHRSIGFLGTRHFTRHGRKG